MVAADSVVARAAVVVLIDDGNIKKQEWNYSTPAF